MPSIERPNEGLEPHDVEPLPSADETLKAAAEAVVAGGSWAGRRAQRLRRNDVELARVLLRIRQSEAIPAALATFRP